MDLQSNLRLRLDEFRQHCTSTSDHRACAWLFTDGPSLPGRRGQRVFPAADAAFPIYLIDVYHGRHPTLLNLATLKYNHEPRFGVRTRVLLDSNLASAVNGYLSGTDASAERTAAVRSFVGFLLQEGIDPSPVFYFIESLAKADKDRWRTFASETAEAVFNLQTLDRALYLADGTLASSIAARAGQIRFQDVGGAGELVSKYVASVGEETAVGEATKLDLSYAALMKATLLRLTNDRSLAQRTIELGEFMAGTLGAVLGLERFIAAAHWTAPERFASFMTPLQRGVRADRLLKKLRSAAWDLYLIRLPEQLGRFLDPNLPAGMDALITLYYIATSEHALAELGRNRSVELLVQHADAEASKIVVGHRDDLMKTLLTPAELEEFAQVTISWETTIAQTAGERRRLEGPALGSLITELENAIVEAAAG